MMDLMKTAIRMTKVYLDANKSNSANVQLQNEYYNVSIIYDGLNLMEDEYFIYLGEFGNESNDFQICKSKIKSMGIRNGAIVINLIDSSEFIITFEAECEVDDGEYILVPT